MLLTAICKCANGIKRKDADNYLWLRDRANIFAIHSFEIHGGFLKALTIEQRITAANFRADWPARKSARR